MMNLQFSDLSIHKVKYSLLKTIFTGVKYNTLCKFKMTSEAGEVYNMIAYCWLDDEEDGLELTVSELVFYDSKDKCEYMVPFRIEKEATKWFLNERWSAFIHFAYN